MNFIKQIDRIKKIHQLIRSEKTGVPSVFVRKLCLSRSQLYNELEVMKSLDAPIKYCKKRESFYYSISFDLELSFSFKTILNDEIREIYGGFVFCPILLDRSILTLQ